MNALEQFKQSVIWHVVTGKYEVSEKGHLLKRETPKKTGTWCGDIPHNWSITRLKDLVTIERGRGEPEETGAFPFYKATSQNPSGNSKTWNHEGPALIIPNGGGSANNPHGDNVAMGKVFRENNQFSACSDTFILKGNYLDWVECVLGNIKETINRTARFTTGLGHLEKRQFQLIPIPIPPPEEAARIVAFIEQFTASLPDTEALKLQLDSWYKELRNGILTGRFEIEEGRLKKRQHFSTTSCPYLKSIPRDWKLKRFKDEVTYTTGQNVEKNLLNTEGNGMQFLRTNDIWERSSKTKEALHYAGDIQNLPVVGPKDAIICTDGFSDEPGKTTIGIFVKGYEGVVGPHLKIIRSTNDWATECHGAKYVTEQLCLNARGSIALSAGHSLNNIYFTEPSDPKERNDLLKVLRELEREYENLKTSLS